MPTYSHLRVGFSAFLLLSFMFSAGCSDPDKSATRFQG